jgi:hypothetical protein
MSPPLISALDPHQAYLDWSDPSTHVAFSKILSLYSPNMTAARRCVSEIERRSDNAIAGVGERRQVMHEATNALPLLPWHSRK